MAINEDFTFPTVADTLSFSIDSPPLWRLSPSASPDNSSRRRDPTRTKENGHKEAGLISKNLSSAAQRRSSSFVEYSKEEKMDMLWEDFNEDSFITRRRRRRSCDDDDSSRFDSGRVNMGCVQALRLSKNNVALYNAKGNNNKVGLVMFIKVLKKFFLLQNPHRSVNHKKSQYFSWTS